MSDNASLPRLPTLPGNTRKIAAAFFLGFWALVLLRFIAGFWVDQPPEPARPSSRPSSGSFDFFSSGYRKDYSSNAVSLDTPLQEAMPAGKLGALEVYTREAKLGATTGRFETDVTAALDIIEEHDAQVRLEANEGVTPGRSFRVVIRAPVERFDDCVAALRKIGHEQTYSVAKEDKSEEVRQRFAERDGLRAYAESLGKLREAGGEVADLIKLESKIQEIEQKIQKLNVSLGEFVKDDSYNNINYSLREQVLLDLDEASYPITSRLARAIAWSAKWTSVAGCLLALAWITRLSIQQLTD